MKCFFAKTLCSQFAFLLGTVALAFSQITNLHMYVSSLFICEHFQHTPITCAFQGVPGQLFHEDFVALMPGGGTHIGKYHGDVLWSWPCFSGQLGLLSLPIYHQCAADVPPIFNFRKIFCIFNPCFGQNFNSQDANFTNFRSQDPSFFKENLFPRPYFWKLVWHTSTKKCWVPLPLGLYTPNAQLWPSTKSATILTACTQELICTNVSIYNVALKGQNVFWIFSVTKPK